MTEPTVNDLIDDLAHGIVQAARDKQGLLASRAWDRYYRHGTKCEAHSKVYARAFGSWNKALALALTYMRRRSTPEDHYRLILKLLHQQLK